MRSDRVMVPGIGRILHRIYATYGVYLEQYCAWDKVIASSQRVLDDGKPTKTRVRPAGLPRGLLNGDLCLRYEGEDLPVDTAFTHKYNFLAMETSGNETYYFFKPLEG
jgi:hypothetical protein